MSKKTKKTWEQIFDEKMSRGVKKEIAKRTHAYRHKPVGKQRTGPRTEVYHSS